MAAKKSNSQKASAKNKAGKPQKDEKRKNTKTEIDPNMTRQMPIAWNFSRMDTGSRWKCSLSALEQYLQKVIGFEGQTAFDIFHNGNRHAHPIGTNKVCENAQNRLDTLNIDVDVLHQLPLAQIPRLWGVLEHNIFHILWLDEDHTVCPTS